MDDGRAAVGCLPAAGGLLRPDLTAVQFAHPLVTDAATVDGMHEMRAGPLPFCIRMV
ncbi:hypothetical protein ABR737_05495 [Streptomyces sp. Edi2]|uniref:hypothetical protein n=1 Tax=Streptomyces sp. Edi2 TaxID=3162528 RepID=UPI00330690ED